MKKSIQKDLQYLKETLVKCQGLVFEMKRKQEKNVSFKTKKKKSSDLCQLSVGLPICFFFFFFPLKQHATLSPSKRIFFPRTLSCIGLLPEKAPLVDEIGSAGWRAAFVALAQYSRIL